MDGIELGSDELNSLAQLEPFSPFNSSSSSSSARASSSSPSVSHLPPSPRITHHDNSHLTNGLNLSKNDIKSNMVFDLQSILFTFFFLWLMYTWSSFWLHNEATL